MTAIIILIALACFTVGLISACNDTQQPQTTRVLSMKTPTVCGILRPNAFAPNDASQDVFMRVPCL